MTDDCGICKKLVRDNEQALCCDICERWNHRACLNMAKTTFLRYEKNADAEWKCEACKDKKQKNKKDGYTIGDIMAKLNEMDNRYNKLFQKYEEQIKINEQLREEVQDIRKQLNTKEQQELNNNAIIQGIPYKENENLDVIVDKLASKLSIPKIPINKIYRLGSRREDRSAPIRIIFRSEEDKKKWMVAKKTKTLTTSDIGGYADIRETIYINHDLTKYNVELFKKAKQYKTENNYKYLWINNGKILLRKDDNSKVTLIETHNDIKN